MNRALNFTDKLFKGISFRDRGLNQSFSHCYIKKIDSLDTMGTNSKEEFEDLTESSYEVNDKLYSPETQDALLVDPDSCGMCG